MSKTVSRLLFLCSLTCFGMCLFRSDIPVAAQSNSGADSHYERVFATKSLDFTPYDLRVEYMKSPVGIDEMRPRFSWKIRSRISGEHQGAYRLTLHAAATAAAAANTPPLWDTGKVESGKTVGIEYAGAELQPNTAYYWNVTCWNKDDRPSSTIQSRFSTGLFQWDGAWIGWDEAQGETSRLTLDGSKWIWPENTPSAPVVKAAFRKTFEIPEGEILDAALAFAADNGHKVYLNGHEIGEGTNFKIAAIHDVSRQIHSGKNVLAVEVANFGESPNPAGLIGVLRVALADDKVVVIPTDETWKSEYGIAANYQSSNFDDSAWGSAVALADLGGGPWGEISLGDSHKSIPARYFRKEFDAEKPRISRATAYISGLGYYEFYLNGRKIGDHLLDPVLTDYDKQVPYVTYEVDPRMISPKANTLGVILGNGRYYAPRITDPTATRTFGYPKLLFQMVLEFADGSRQTILSDGTWKVTTEGPIRENNDYDGEIYDARKEIPHWSERRWDAKKYGSLFKDVQLVDAPKGKLVSQMMPPMRKTVQLKAQSYRQVRPGVWVYDFGQNLVGWTRMKVRGPAGTEVKLRFAETLQEEGEEKGMLYVANLRAAKCRDLYTLKGAREEFYEPRFAYHGFRYAEITGFPGRPNRDTLTAYAINTDLPLVGSFECSNPLVNRIYKNIEWGVRGNYLSIPTDCPQRDERQGWQGDRAGESLGEMFLFDNYTLYAKWLKDIEDSQREDGNLSDVCPNFWPLYSSNVTWPSAFTIIPGSLYRMYGDERPIKRHYEAMKKWMDHLAGFIREDGTLEQDNYGDWCVPPEKPELIHSQDPARRTSRGILATSYYIHNLRLLSRYATMLGKEDEARQFDARAEKMTEAFNARFYDAQTGRYDNGTQTSCVLPLAFGLVPESEKKKVFATLIGNIENVTNHHIGTGLIGGQWLNMTLSNFGRDDISYRFVQNDAYPSWGYMVRKGATTVWELWNGDTADPAMNSGNHVMLVGDLIIWLYTRVAGLPSPDPENPGVLIFSPNPGGDLKYAKAQYDSVYGMIRSGWRIRGNKMLYDVTVPVGQKGILLLPSEKIETVRESGNRPFEKAIVVFESQNEESINRVECRVSSGTYSFECEL